MDRLTLRRLAKLEETHARLSSRPWREVMIEDGDDLEPVLEAMIANGQAREGDNFIVTVVVDPPSAKTSAKRP
jgi:hypothetical protein